MITKNPSIPIFDIGPKTRVIDFLSPFSGIFKILKNQNFQKVISQKLAGNLKIGILGLSKVT